MSEKTILFQTSYRENLLQKLTEAPTALDEIKFQVISQEALGIIIKKNLKKHLIADYTIDLKDEDVCIYVQKTVAQVESEREEEFLKLVFDKIGVDNIQVLQTMGRKIRILMRFDNPLETEIWYIYGRFIEHDTCKDITKFFQREYNSHGNVGQLYDDFD